MRLLWNEPSKTSVSWDQYSAIHWEEAVLGWLRYMGVWPERDPRHWCCEYNDLYHFFMITVFECWLPGHGEKDETIKAMRAYLQNSGLDWEERSTWTWDDGKKRPGVIFWIQAEDHPKKEARTSMCLNAAQEQLEKEKAAAEQQVKRLRELVAALLSNKSCCPTGIRSEKMERMDRAFLESWVQEACTLGVSLYSCPQCRRYFVEPIERCPYCQQATTVEGKEGNA